jgi:hypothetical protein
MLGSYTKAAVKGTVILYIFSVTAYIDHDKKEADLVIVSAS